jgi:superfamily II DNA or RNA helicase
MLVPLTVDSRVRIPTRGLSEEVVDRLREEFDHKNPRHGALAAMGRPTYSEPRKIATYQDESRHLLSVPRGGLQRVRDILRRAGLEWDADDRRSEGAQDLAGRIPTHTVTLWEHQEAAVVAAIAKENCIIRAPTGSGKTTMGFAIASRVNLPTLVIVPTTGIFNQWLERAQTELGLKKSDIGIIKGKTRRIKPLTIAMQKTLSMMVEAGDTEILDTFGCVIGDEVHLFAARTFFAAVDPLRARHRYGISADERRKDRKEFLIYDVFGQVAYQVERDVLIEREVIVDTEVYVVPTDFRADWYGVPPDEEDDDGASEASSKEGVDFGRLLDEMAADPERARLALYCVRTILAAGRQALVMAHRREHCRSLDRSLVEAGVTSGFLIGGDDYATEFDKTLAGLKAGDVRAAIGTIQAIGYGIDLPTIGDVVLPSPVAGNGFLYNQIRGRVCRSDKGSGKEDSRFWYLWDRHVFGLKHVRNLVRWNKHVLVLDGAQWVEGRAYIKAHRKKKGAA